MSDIIGDSRANELAYETSIRNKKLFVGSGNPMYGKKHPNPKLSEWNKQHSGELSPTYGIKRPDLSERNKSGLFKRYTRKIICVETGIIYNSIKEATISLGKSPTSAEINKHLNGSRKHAFGFHWEYYLCDGNII